MNPMVSITIISDSASLTFCPGATLGYVEFNYYFSIGNFFCDRSFLVSDDHDRLDGLWSCIWENVPLFVLNFGKKTAD